MDGTLAVDLTGWALSDCCLHPRLALTSLLRRPQVSEIQAAHCYLFSLFVEQMSLWVFSISEEHTGVTGPMHGLVVDGQKPSPWW